MRTDIAYTMYGTPFYRPRDAERPAAQGNPIDSTAGLPYGELAKVAAAMAALPASQSPTLQPAPRSAGTIAPSDRTALDQAWNLASFTPTGEALLRLMEADGARVEVVPDAEFASMHPHAPGVARVRAMGPLDTRHGTVQVSSRLVVRVARSTLAQPEQGALLIAEQAAHHALERDRMPLPAADAAVVGDARRAIANVVDPLDAAAPQAVHHSLHGLERTVQASMVRAAVAKELGTTDSGPGTGSDGRPRTWLETHRALARYALPR